MSRFLRRCRTDRHPTRGTAPAPETGAPLGPNPEAPEATAPRSGQARPEEDQPLVVRVRDLTVTADGPEGESVLLQGLTCTLGAARTAVIGENGSGKSTLVRVIAGLMDPAAGSVTVHGVDAVADRRRLRRRVGFVFANPGAQAIMPVVREDVALTLRGRDLSTEQVRQTVDAALAEHGLSDLADRACQSLSSGQMQRLALCSVLVGGPDLVIADEPTSMLDARHRRIIADRLLAPAARQVLLVTHDMDLAARCDEAVLIRDGTLEAQGPPDEVIARYHRSLEEPGR